MDKCIEEKNESIVSPVARRYTRVVNGRERLVVCLSEYVPLRILHVQELQVDEARGPRLCTRRHG